ncbi:MAG: VIT1/CCC1 transporter family protein [Bacilli bacterium]
MENNLTADLRRQALISQQDEINGYALYAFMAKRQEKKYPENAKVLSQMSRDELKHYSMWAKITGVSKKPHIFFAKILTVILGITFMIKSMQKGERLSTKSYEELKEEIPSAALMVEDERRHEKELYSLVDEERLHYVGDMVLGLNDALVELTGAITGVTFSLADCRLIALTGIVTGVAATLSMMASNYLAQKEEGKKNPIKSSLYTGTAYLITVILLVLPYLLFMMSSDPYAYIYAFAVMIGIVILEIGAFNYYLSVAQEKKFWKHYLLMAGISLSVAAISFGIGYLAKFALGIQI